MVDQPQLSLPILPPEALALPTTEVEAQAAAQRDGWQIPPACVPGVMGNLALLARHAAIFAGNAA
ncbi:hypothetical protein [Novosphingobium sp. SG720]|uniref:hypothetical protein n=1 Tax=Novosphingobium sp. SG720 TaxID=2586998 RepID=UPI001448A1B4|nr:hypothetical protein [Novosphingobium sp. SG720]NKJ41955.1 hypothetical protein [Novosphingobium sp. SG720]